MGLLRQRSSQSSKALPAACSPSLFVRLSTSSKAYYLLSNTEILVNWLIFNGLWVFNLKAIVLPACFDVWSRVLFVFNSAVFLHKFAEQTDSNFSVLYRSIYPHPQLRHRSLPFVFPHYNTDIIFRARRPGWWSSFFTTSGNFLQENCQKKPAWDHSWWAKPKSVDSWKTFYFCISLSTVCCLCNNCFTSLALICWFALFLFFTFPILSSSFHNLISVYLISFWFNPSEKMRRTPVKQTSEFFPSFQWTSLLMLYTSFLTQFISALPLFQAV